MAEERIIPVNISVSAQFDDRAEARKVLDALNAVLNKLDLDKSSVVRISASLSDDR